MLQPMRAKPPIDPAMAERFADDLVFVPGDEARSLRNAFGCFATGITLITTKLPDGTPCGCTVSSLASVSLEPPLLLFSLGNASALLSAIRGAGQFGVNVLGKSHEGLSNAFCGPVENRFQSDDWVDGQYGMPVLAGAVASFQCSLYADYPGGDHAIILGEIHRARFQPERDPLLFFGGRYRELGTK